MDSTDIAAALPTLDLQYINERAEETEAIKTSQDLQESEEHDDDASIASDESEMERFEDYKPKIDDLLHSIGLTDFSVSEIQHGYSFQNCVYALTSCIDPTEQYILRLPVLPELEDDGICQEIESNVALLGYLRNKLPVPAIKAWSSRSDNVLEKPYTIQTRLPGVSLNNIYDDLTHEEKRGIVDQFVQLLAKVESIRFTTAGTFTAASSVPQDNGNIAAPSISFFNEGDEEYMQIPNVAQERSGADLKSLLDSHTYGWIAKELKDDESLTLASLRFLTSMIDDLDREGAFVEKSHPIVLHHWDLEPRNIMVERISGAWRIQGIIDWDATLALPRPLARRAPAWIWDFDFEGFTGYLDNDHHPKADSELSVEDAALKAYFNARAAETLEGYLEDAYGHGMWLRRIWTFAKSGANSCWYIDLIRKLEEDWISRPVPKCLSSSGWVGVLEKTLRWVSSLVVSLRRWL
ncbi:MAG: hypothetical protein Q9216_004528 [Gyalolechia sp. 2 TL-2023]